jgi:hypothetical protein
MGTRKGHLSAAQLRTMQRLLEESGIGWIEILYFGVDGAVLVSLDGTELRLDSHGSITHGAEYPSGAVRRVSAEMAVSADPGR